MDEDFETLKAKAEAGDANAQFKLGWAYYFGEHGRLLTAALGSSQGQVRLYGRQL